MAEPWIRVHANLAGKPVVWRAVERLGVSQHEALGLMVQFWGAVSQHATNGIVSGIPDVQLEAWAGWRGKRGRFATFIREAHLDGDGRVNEWDDYAGKLEQRRATERDRLRNKRHNVAQQSTNESEMLAPARANDTKRDDTREASSSPRRRTALESALADRLPSDADRVALTAVLYRAPNALAWAAELTAMLDKMGGHIPAEPKELGEALREYLANLAPDASPNIRHFKSYVERIVQAPAAKPSHERQPARNGAGRATLVFGKIKGLVRESQQPGQGVRRFISRKEVEALGPDVIAAYDAIGGSERVLGATGEQMGFVIRDFTAALAEAGHV